MIHFKEIVLKYYKLVDSKSLKKMLRLFSNKIIYVRAGKTISGMTSFRDFYLQDRKIDGKHTIYETNHFENIVIVKGIFEGTNSTGNMVDIDFVDYFYFNDHGKILRRETFTASGYALIK